MRSTALRQQSYRLGWRAETLCAWALRLKGYRILARRTRTPFGEIDLIARRGRLVAFIEVKARGSLEAGLYAAPPAQQQRILRAAQSWLTSHPRYATLDMRFDLMLVSPLMRGMVWPRHVRDAFRQS